jgi:hypothetical protein
MSGGRWQGLGVPPAVPAIAGPADGIHGPARTAKLKAAKVMLFSPFGPLDLDSGEE